MQGEITAITNPSAILWMIRIYKLMTKLSELAFRFWSSITEPIFIVIYSESRSELSLSQVITRPKTLRLTTASGRATSKIRTSGTFACPSHHRQSHLVDIMKAISYHSTTSHRLTGASPLCLTTLACTSWRTPSRATMPACSHTARPDQVRA